MESEQEKTALRLVVVEHYPLPEAPLVTFPLSTRRCFFNKKQMLGLRAFCVTVSSRIIAVDRENLETMVLQAKGEINQIEQRIAELTARRQLLWHLVVSSEEVIQVEAGKPVNGGLSPASAVVRESPCSATLLCRCALGRLWEGVQALVMGAAKLSLDGAGDQRTA